MIHIIKPMQCACLLQDLLRGVSMLKVAHERLSVMKVSYSWQRSNLQRINDQGDCIVHEDELMMISTERT